MFWKSRVADAAFEKLTGKCHACRRSLEEPKERRKCKFALAESTVFALALISEVVVLLAAVDACLVEFSALGAWGLLAVPFMVFAGIRSVAALIEWGIKHER